MGNVHHAGEYHVLIVPVVVKVLDVLFELSRVDFPVMLGKLQHLMAGTFDGTCLMDAHMACLCRHNAFIGS